MKYAKKTGQEGHKGVGLSAVDGLGCLHMFAVGCVGYVSGGRASQLWVHYWRLVNREVGTGRVTYRLRAGEVESDHAPRT